MSLKSKLRSRPVPYFRRLRLEFLFGAAPVPVFFSVVYGSKGPKTLAFLRLRLPNPALQKNVKNQTIENAVISGKSEKEPNQYPFGTTYDAIYNDLKTQEHIKHDKYIHIYCMQECSSCSSLSV